MLNRIVQTVAVPENIDHEFGLSNGIYTQPEKAGQTPVFKFSSIEP